VGGLPKTPPANGDRRISDQNRCRLESTTLMSGHRCREFGRNHPLDILRRVLPFKWVFKRLDVFGDLNRRIGHQQLRSNAQSAKKLASPGAL
jgi:hypothetical protein